MPLLFSRRPIGVTLLFRGQLAGKEALHLNRSGIGLEDNLRR
jgi:hypothetical protein